MARTRKTFDEARSLTLAAPLYAGIFALLDTVLFVRTGSSGAFRIHGMVPAWWNDVFGPTHVNDVECTGSRGLFLREFLHSIDDRLTDFTGSVIHSGPWTEYDDRGVLFHFEATVLKLESRQALLVRRLGSDFEQFRTTLQKARDKALRHEQAVSSFVRAQSRLATQLSRSEEARDDLVNLLDALGLATVLVDRHGQLSFLSGEAVRMLNTSLNVLGRKWDELLPCAKREREAVRARLRRPRGGPALTIALQITPQKWLDLTVYAHPRHKDKRILMFQDSTEMHDLRRLLDDRGRFHDLVGDCPSMMEVYRSVRDVARVDSTVLIEGETGTGKELIARAIHFSSARKQGPFIAANCAGLTDSLLNSQLFGHKRGSFTGALSDQPGLFESADGGTVFLDEIGDIPANVQASLLRVLQEKEITRVGEAKPKKVNVRVIAATHHNLSEDVVRGSFRADLLYRIRVARIHLPPLRERRDDIPLLAGAFLGQIRSTMGKAVDRIEPDALKLLLAYSWPGNVRELKSAIEFAAIGCKGQKIGACDLPPEIRRPPSAGPIDAWVPFGSMDERSRLVRALTYAGGNRAEAARLLGVSRATFYRRLTDLGIGNSSPN
jgi:transcriptional regulator with PAS, ATPase and Fis domain